MRINHTSATFNFKRTHASIRSSFPGPTLLLCCTDDRTCLAFPYRNRRQVLTSLDVTGSPRNLRQVSYACTGKLVASKCPVPGAVQDSYFLANSISLLLKMYFKSEHANFAMKTNPSCIQRVWGTHVRIECNYQSLR